MHAGREHSPKISTEIVWFRNSGGHEICMGMKYVQTPVPIHRYGYSCTRYHAVTVVSRRQGNEHGREDLRVSKESGGNQGQADLDVDKV